MSRPSFPSLDPASIVSTRDAVHSYAQILGSWRHSCLPRRKHWWQLAILPSIEGLTTGMIQSSIDFKLDLDLATNCLRGSVVGGSVFSEPLNGRPPSELAAITREFLLANGLDPTHAPPVKEVDHSTVGTPSYSTDVAESLAHVFRSVSGAMNTFRSDIREETSPIQIWPHHFDLAMMWLPGEKIAGQDPMDEEASDKQMNFGFTFGDQSISEPYFYITSYPLPEVLPNVKLPGGATWHTHGFSGVVVRYSSLKDVQDPGSYLIKLWDQLLKVGQREMKTNKSS
ncbi:hypothetical protein HQ496_03890 [bacterium]|nr:hypothetical protein [bacterium]